MQNFQGTVFIINTKIHGEFQICISLPFTGGSRAAATSKMRVNGFKPLRIITKHSILDVAAALDQSLVVLTQLATIQDISKNPKRTLKVPKFLIKAF